jgi:hypothetical protein
MNAGVRRSCALLAASLTFCSPAAACTVDHRCAKRLVATAKLRHWTTPQTIPADASLQVRVWVGGRPLSSVVDGYTAIFTGQGVIASATAKRRAAPIRLRYAAEHKRRIRFVYWIER